MEERRKLQAPKQAYLSLSVLRDLGTRPGCQPFPSSSVNLGSWVRTAPKVIPAVATCGSVLRAGQAQLLCNALGEVPEWGQGGGREGKGGAPPLARKMWVTLNEVP